MSNENKTILLVEDDPTLRELVSMVLELDGYKVIITHNGKEAIDYLTDHNVDVVILDLFMPVLDGVHVLYWIRVTKAFDMPVIVMTAETDDITQQSIMAAGANAFLKKPLDVSKITQTIDDLLNQ